MKKKADYLKVSGVDFVNALYHAIIASAIPFAGFLSAGRMPTQSEWYIIGGASLSAFIGALFKRGLTNSQGDLFTEEPTTVRSN
jgi:hypothetical protein